MLNKIKTISEALDAMYDRLGYLRERRLLSTVALVVWYLIRGRSEYDTALAEIRKYHPADIIPIFDNDAIPMGIVRIDTTFYDVVRGIAFGLGVTVIAYAMSFIPPTWLGTLWATYITIMALVFVLSYMLYTIVPLAPRLVPTCNGALVYQLSFRA